MKTLQKIFAWLSLILIVAGGMLILIKYLTNRSLFAALVREPMVQQSIGIFRVMLYGLIAILIGFIFLSLSFKIGSSIRGKERAEAKARKAIEKEQAKAAKEAEAAAAAVQEDSPEDA